MWLLSLHLDFLLLFFAFLLSVFLFTFFHFSDEQQPELNKKFMENLCDSANNGCEGTYDVLYLPLRKKQPSSPCVPQVPCSMSLPRATVIAAHQAKVQSTESPNGPAPVELNAIMTNIEDLIGDTQSGAEGTDLEEPIASFMGSTETCVGRRQ